MEYKILISDDDQGVLSALKLLFKTENYHLVFVNSPEKALIALQQQEFDLVLMDLNYSQDTTSGEEGLKLIESLRKLDEIIPIVVMTGWGTIDVAVKTMRNGANDFIQKPWENERLLTIISNQIKLAKSYKKFQKLSQQNKILEGEINTYESLIANSTVIKSVMETINRVAKSDASVLLTGENGTGKSLFARYLHEKSKRKEEPLISVNMGAVPESLFESEMFGHIKGAFTDAKNNRIGRFDLADEGTLFLDEVANTPYSQQGKLLRVLENSQFEKVGSSITQTVNIRLITATNADLDQEVSEGKFRMDLLYRINTVEINIPPLRERNEDIIPLANLFLQKSAHKYSTPLMTIDDDARKALLTYSWPGNVRELSQVMERANILCQSLLIGTYDLRLNVNNSNNAISDEEVNDNALLKSMNEIEASIVAKRLMYFDGDANKAAKSLGWSRSTFYRQWKNIKKN